MTQMIERYSALDPVPNVFYSTRTELSDDARLGVIKCEEEIRAGMRQYARCSPEFLAGMRTALRIVNDLLEENK